MANLNWREAILKMAATFRSQLSGKADVTDLDSVSTKVDAMQSSVDSKVDSTTFADAIGGKVSKGSLLINVSDYAVGDGVADDSQALRDAAADARAGNGVLSSRQMYLPAGALLYVNQIVDLRYVIDLRLEGRILVGPAGKLIVGHSSNQRPGQNINLASVLWKGAQTNTCVEVRGMKQATMRVGTCSKLDMIADDTTDSVNDGSLAYNTVELGRITNLNLIGLGNGWITQNLFLGGTIVNLSMSGTYSHNENTFYKPCVEGGAVTLNSGSRNYFIQARCEGGTVVTFAAGTIRNYFEDSFVSNPTTRVMMATVNDSGQENVYVSTTDRSLSPVQLAAVDVSTVVLDTARNTNGSALTPGLDKLIVPKQWDFVIDTGIFPVATPAGTSIPAYSSRSVMRRFQFSSDAALWRPYVEVFDTNMNRLTATTLLKTIGTVTLDATTQALTLGSNLSGLEFLLDPSVAYVRIRIRNGAAANSQFRTLTLNGYVNAPSDTGVAERVTRQYARPLWQSVTTAPTKGVAPLGTVVRYATGKWVSTARVDTSLAAAAIAADTTLTVGATAGMAQGNVVGVLLDDGTTHWTTVASVASGTSITLAAGLPSGAAIGKTVSTVGWSA